MREGELLDKIVDFWRKEHNAHAGGQYGDKKVARHIAKLLELSGRESLLDVGCGEGLLLSNLPAGKKTGLDYSRQSVEIARKKNPGARFVVGDADKLPFKNNSFDRVLSHSTFIYYSSSYAERALHELERVCKPEGVILVGDVEDVDCYRGGRLGYKIRTAVLDLLGKPYYTCFARDFFESRGFKTEKSPFNKRFNAVKRKEK